MDSGNDLTFIVGVVALIIAVIVVVMKAKSSNYHEAGSGGTRAFEPGEYGVPIKSLYTSRKLVSLHHHIDITDENENLVYEANSKVVSIHDKTDVTKADGTHVAHIERKLLTLREVHNVTMADGTEFQLSNEILHIIRDVTNILGLGWKLEGNILQMNFVIKDEAEKVIAVISQKLISIHDKYCIDIYQEEDEEKIIAILVALQHMITDREAATVGAGAGGGAAASSSSGSSN